jgi:hypothetical protein
MRYVIRVSYFTFKKSKITNLFSAYKDAGILHLLMYMKDTDNEADWTDLVSLSNIESAAKNKGKWKR